jgi:hypothetical protein
MVQAARILTEVKHAVHPTRQADRRPRIVGSNCARLMQKHELLDLPVAIVLPVFADLAGAVHFEDAAIVAVGHEVPVAGRLDVLNPAASRQCDVALFGNAGAVDSEFDDPLRENLAAISVTLSPDEIALLDRLSEPKWGYPYSLIGRNHAW